ncbi:MULTISPECIES: ABC transporter permease [Stappiaceae]|jgi:peptide/nickel transport system permease protein|uniref:ABC transporter permease n=1 Tax=Stappiaceae TaxID=2821832 RepID=UPI00092AA825|nr:MULTISPECIES: ABC transporter permease [Stappiaceae]MBO9420828.1 ABC transporter permease [Labrenzia sp. R4_2]MBO9425693.1 ABC transporter permease [Labrenzia sp. R4_1]OJJ10523.1 ABC transporter permease [Alphaproteobacteria bacterium AO1-B]
MSVFVIRRLMQAFLVVFLMSVIVFFGVNIVGDPVYMLVSPDADQADIEAAIRRLGLDRPIWDQYLLFLKGAAQGNLGDSFIFGEPALKLILHHMPATLELAFSALMLAIVIGIPLGLFSGLYPDNPISKGIMAGSILGFSLPTFWVGLMLILLFAVELGWLPSTGRGDTATIFGIETSLATWDGLRHIFLPALNLALLKISLAIRLTRAGVREAMSQDYVKYARAKGISTRRIIFVHVMKNIMIPVVTVMGLEFGSLIGFSVVTETIFAWPGMGKLLIDAILQLDRPVVVAYLMIMVLFFVVINLVVDILYSILDPRVRLQDQGA